MDTGKRFLVVDDEEIYRERAREMLLALGFTKIEVVNSGVEALQRLQSEAFDFVVSDLMMPEMSGVKLLAKIRNDQSIKALPFLLVTSAKEAVIKMIAIRVELAEMPEYLGKNTNTETFGAKIKEILEKRSE